jgi:polyisoprenoid-binding protein YceI
MGVAVDGKFRRFSSQLEFRPGQADRSPGSLRCRTGQRRYRRPGRRRGSRRQAWFNTRAFPTARFVSTGVKALGGNRYEVSGQLTIKGKTQEVVVPATFTAQGNSGVFDGSFTIRRGDFSIGEGSWAKFDIVANEVLIKFRITAATSKPQPPTPENPHEKLTNSPPSSSPLAACRPGAGRAGNLHVVDSNHTFPRFSYSHFGYSTQLSRFNKTTGTVVLDKAAKTG